MRFVEAVCILFLKMCTTPSQNDHGEIRDFCCRAPGWRFRVGGPQQIAFFASCNLSSFVRGAETNDPCRGFASPRPALILSCFPPGLQSATPVEDSALPIQLASPRPQDVHKMPSRRPYMRPRGRQGATTGRQYGPRAAKTPHVARQAAPKPLPHARSHLLTRADSFRPSGRFLSSDPPSSPP